MKTIISLTLLQVFVATKLLADPTSFSVGNMKFARPDHWREVSPTEGPGSARFEVLTNGVPSSTHVVIYKSSLSSPLAKKKWYSLFGGISGSSEGSFTVNGEKVEKRVEYVTITGTYQPESEQKQDYHLIGAVIAQDGQSVIVRLIGPQMDAEKELEGIEKMVQNALREKLE